MDAGEAAAVPPTAPTGAVSMGERFRAARKLHLKSEATKLCPAAALKRPAAAAPLVAGVHAHRLRRRLRGKQPRPGAWAVTIDADLIEEKLESSKNVDCCASWGYHRARKAIVKAGQSDARAKAMGSQWHRGLKDMRKERCGDA